MLEPLALALHAMKRAGAVSGRRVLVTGGGPIGKLVAPNAQAFGAVPMELSDILESRRATLDPRYPAPADETRAPSGDGFDLAFAAAGARSALHQALELVPPDGSIG